MNCMIPTYSFDHIQFFQSRAVSNRSNVSFYCSVKAIHLNNYDIEYMDFDNDKDEVVIVIAFGTLVHKGNLLKALNIDIFDY